MTTEILTVDEFALRMRLSRATVFVWMQKGILERGRHYLKQGRVLRFLWNEETIQALAETSPEPQKRISTVAKPVKAGPINWEY